MRETLKFNRWANYYSDPKQKDTYGNATKSAIKAYGYTSPSQYHLASVTGSKNMRKYENIALVMCEQEGFGYKELLRIGIKKMIDGSFSDWERFMIRIGYFTEHPVIQQNTQNNFHFGNLGEAIAQARRERGLPV